MNKNLRMIAAAATIATLASSVPVLTVYADSTTTDTTTTDTTTTDSTTTGAAVTVTTGAAVSTDQTPKNLGDAITEYFSSFTASNGITEDMLKAYCSELRTNYSLYVTIENYKVKNATWSNNGNIDCTVIITKGNDGTTYSMPLSVEIPELSFSSNTELMAKAISAISNVTFTDEIKQDSIISLIKSAINDPSINVGISDFTLVDANYTAIGTVKGKIILTNSSNETLTMPFERPVYLTSEEQVNYNDLVKETQSVQNSLYNLSFTSIPTQQSIQEYINTLLAKTNYTANIVEFGVINEATEEHMGKLSLTLQLTDTTTKHQIAVTNNINIYTQATYNIKTTIESAMSKITYTKDTTEKDILADIRSALNDSSLDIGIYNYNSKYDESTNTLSYYYTIEVEDNYGNDIIQNTNSMVKISSTASSGSSGSSGGSSGSSGGSSTSSDNNATSTNTSEQTQSTNITPINIATITPEVAKEITNKVISNVTAILGNGTIMGESTQVATANGGSVTVTPITKSGQGAGLVIAASNADSIATIPINSSNGQVTAVYKYIPLLGKYIQVTDAVTIGTDSITLPTQANATYVAATSSFASTDTVSQGWAKVNNNWYMVNANGDPQTGWQKDNTGSWAYLNKSNGIMNTGWLNDNGAWYHLGSNGYMSTGWLKDGDSWYYLNQDGSMVANTTVDGYTLSSTGALV